MFSCKISKCVSTAVLPICRDVCYDVVRFNSKVAFLTNKKTLTSVKIPNSSGSFHCSTEDYSSSNGCQSHNCKLRLSVSNSMVTSLRYLTDNINKRGEQSELRRRRRRFLAETNSKFSQTKQLIKETRERVKERVEEIIMRENILTVPNALCATRIIMSPFLAYLVLKGSYEVALGLFVIAGITDLLDGYIARNFANQRSMFGSFLDPLADKLLVFCLMLSLTVRDLIPVPLTSLIIVRDAILVAAGCYIRYFSLQPPKTFAKYFDPTLVTAQLSPTFISKANTTLQLVLVAATLASTLLHFDATSYLQFLWYVTATTTVASGLGYVTSENTYKIIQKIKDEKRGH